MLNASLIPMVEQATVYGVTDTGLSISDSVHLTQLPRHVADTGLNISDTVVSTRQRAITDTGLNLSDSVVHGYQPFGISDYGIGSVIGSDQFNRTVTPAAGASYGTMDTGQTWTIIANQAGSDYGVNGTQAVDDIAALNATRRGQLITGGLPNMEGLTKTSLTLPIGSSVFSQIFLRNIDNSNMYQIELVITPAGAIQYRVRVFVAAVSTTLAGPTTKTTGYSSGDMWWLRGRCEYSLVSLRIWKDGTNEPTSWDSQSTDSAGLVGGTKYGIGAAGNASTTNVVTVLNEMAQFASVFYESVVPTHSLGISDTGLSLSDSVLRDPVARVVIDTGLTLSDTTSTTRQRPITDTGLNLSDSVVSARVRGIVDTGLSISDSPQTTRTRPIVDTGLSLTDSVSTARVRAIIDTGLTLVDSITLLHRHVLADTALTFSDSVIATYIPASAGGGPPLNAYII